MTARSVFFDLDGTLVNSLEDIADAINYARGVFAQLPLDVDAVRAMVGKGSRNLVERALPGFAETDLDHALDLFLAFNKQHIADKSRLYPGIQEVLHQLAALDIKLAVISNKNEEHSTLILQRLGIYDLFEIICGGDTYPEKKPSPLPLLKVAEKLGAAPCACIMVGDSINDILAAKQSGIPSIGCMWGFGSGNELTGADSVVTSPQKLFAAITAELH